MKGEKQSRITALYIQSPTERDAADHQKKRYTCSYKLNLNILLKMIESSRCSVYRVSINSAVVTRQELMPADHAADKSEKAPKTRTPSFCWHCLIRQAFFVARSVVIVCFHSFEHSTWIWCFLKLFKVDCLDWEIVLWIILSWKHCQTYYQYVFSFSARA